MMIKYAQLAPAYDEYPVTGVNARWQPGQLSDVTGARLAALLATGLFADVELGTQEVPITASPSAQGVEIIGEVAFPKDFPWPQSKFPIQLWRTGRRVVTDFVAENQVNPACYTGPCYHVDGLYGLDTNTGLGSYVGDYGQAFKTIKKAQDTLNAGGVAGRIKVKIRKGVVFNRVAGAAPWPIPTVPTLAEGDGPGRAKVRMSDSLAWTLDTGTTYWATRATVSRVFDVLYEDDGYSNYVELKKVADETVVRTTPGSWAQGAGANAGKVYISRLDAAAVTDSNTAVMLVTNVLKLDDTTPSGCGFFNFEFEGGYPVDVVGTSAAAVDKKFVFKNCGARYSHLAFNNWRLRDCPGLIALIDCEGFYAGADSFNVHWSLGGVSPMYVFFFNCRSRYNGLLGNQSNNSETGHETCVVLSVLGDYGSSFGGEVAYINDSQIFLVEPTVIDSRGDVVLGGGFDPVCIQALDNAKVWIDGGVVGCKVYSMRARQNAVIRYRGTRSVGGSMTVAENGIIETY